MGISPAGRRLALRAGAAPAVWQKHILVVGEAIGTSIPGSGEGMSIAMKTGLLAACLSAEAIEAGNFAVLAEYPRRLEEATRKLPEMWI